MASAAVPFTCCDRPSLALIDTVVSARLGPTRIPGNQQPACFNRQIAMYLAKYVGRWSTTQIGRFYNGRDHSTVCYGTRLDRRVFCTYSSGNLCRSATFCDCAHARLVALVRNRHIGVQLSLVAD
jgi:hypothetical protein